jgi:hypothetical protein
LKTLARLYVGEHTSNIPAPSAEVTGQYEKIRYYPPFEGAAPASQ